METGTIDVGLTLLLGILSSLLATVLIVAYRSKIRSGSERTLHYLFDTTAHAKLKRVDKYQQSPQQHINHQLFKEIQSEIDGISLKGIGENYLTIKRTDLDTNIEILLEADQSNVSDVAFSSSTDQRYKVIIQTDPSMSFGYRTYEDLDRFRTISNKISNIASKYCFGDANPSKSFVIGELETRVPVKEKDIEDKNLGLRARVEGSKMVFNFSKPENVTRGIRAYFQPFNSYDS